MMAETDLQVIDKMTLTVVDWLSVFRCLLDGLPAEDGLLAADGLPPDGNQRGEYDLSCREEEAGSGGVSLGGGDIGGVS